MGIYHIRQILLEFFYILEVKFYVNLAKKNVSETYHNSC